MHHTPILTAPQVEHVPAIDSSTHEVNSSSFSRAHFSNISTTNGTTADTHSPIIVPTVPPSILNTHSMQTRSNALLDWGFKCSASNTSLFYTTLARSPLLLLVYVDDILITGANTTTISQLIAHLKSKFALKSLGSINFFLGSEVVRTHTGLHLTQTKYATKLLHKANLQNSRPVPTPMILANKLSLGDSSLYEKPEIHRSIIGALQYLTLTRPDISYSVNKLSQFIKAPTVNHWNACKRILRYVNGTLNLGLHFKPAYFDADWASSLDDRKSTSGFCLFLGGNLISWGSCKQKAVAHSSTESEYHALASAATELVWLTSLLNEIGIPISMLPILWCDNQDA
ncbi:uncharacterized mitochondrial protein AtMg00810-like [Humulus lupulus]|uniref:uncharacterized mitochondrial protein AtMg00810-like n=1 Tax=Humulus lupulus TaxID=3486 RepID=UPI002B413F14|nr:uncharacterized mitochondrial protein AtMg00810-like [Humulus lupulus]